MIHPFQTSFEGLNTRKGVNRPGPALPYVGYDILGTYPSHLGDIQHAPRYKGCLQTHLKMVVLYDAIASPNSGGLGGL